MPAEAVAEAGRCLDQEPAGSFFAHSGVRLRVPHEKPAHRADAEHHDRGVHVDDTRLESAQDRAESGHEQRSEPRDDSIDEPLVEQRGGLGERFHQGNDRALVELVDAPLVEHEPVQARCFAGELRGRRTVLHHVDEVSAKRAHHERQDAGRRQKPGGKATGGGLHDLLAQLEDRFEPFFESGVLGYETWVEDPAEQREQAEHDERERHRPRRLVRLGSRLGFTLTFVMGAGLGAGDARSRGTYLPPAEVSPEREKERAEHVEGGHRGSEDAHPIERRPEPRRSFPTSKPLLGRHRVDVVHVSAIEDLVFGKETRREREAADGQARGNEGPVRDRKPSSQAAHVAHVLRGRRIVDGCMHGVNDRTCAEKQACLEKRVRQKVKEPRREGAHADAEEHETELAHGGIGEHLFDVVLREADRRREKGSQNTDRGDRRHDERGQQENPRQSTHQVNAGGHHRRRVDEGAHRRGTGHRIG